MPIEWSPRALSDLDELQGYLAEESEGASGRVLLDILDGVMVLREFPNYGRSGRVTGTRELVVPHNSFIVPYRVKNERIEILRVLHAAREWPDSF